MKVEKNNLILLVAAFILVTILFQIIYGLHILLPANINWLMSARHDWGTHYLGWAFHKQEAWHFPLGDIESYLYPAGTNVGFTDSIPLIAIPLKVIAPLLPDDFQYFGLWLYACYLFMAYYSLKIFQLYNIKPVYQIIGMLFIVGNPMLVYRGMHPALCAHGFILASVYLYLKTATSENVNSINKKQIVLIALSSLINPYLCALIFGFNFILPFKHYYYNKLLNLKQFLGYFLTSILSVVVLWFIVGMLTFKGSTRLEVTDGYGLYGFNLNSFYNSSGFSSFLPQLPTVNDFQYESYMYLGLGLMAIILLGIVAIFKFKQQRVLVLNKTLIPILVLTIILTLFAISNVITYSDNVLLNIPLPQLIIKIGNIVRASARFAWLLYYLLCLSGFILIVKSNVSHKLKLPVLSLLLALQFYDISPIYTFRNLPAGTYDNPLTEAKWNTILPDFKHIVTYPPYENHLLKDMDYQDLSYLALKNNLPITLGYAARVNRKAEAKYYESVTASLENGFIRSHDIYITTHKHLEKFQIALTANPEIKIDSLDGYYYVYNTAASDTQANTVGASADIKMVLTDKILQDAEIQYNIENISMRNKSISLKGWAFIKDKVNNKGDSLFVAVINKNDIYIAKTTQQKRPDVTSYFKRNYLEDSGFISLFKLPDSISVENSTLAISIKSADSWYISKIKPLSEIENVNIPKKITVLPPEGDQSGRFENVQQTGYQVVLDGWSIFNNKGSNNTKISVLFKGEQGNYILPTKSVERKDVTKAYNNIYNYDNSGFVATLNNEYLPQGKYEIGIIINDGKESSLLMTNKEVSIY